MCGHLVSPGSIISKKAAESLNSLVLDVKFGRSAICKDLASAKALGESLVSIRDVVTLKLL